MFSDSRNVRHESGTGQVAKAHLNHRQWGRALGRRGRRRSDPDRCHCCSGCRYPSKTSPPPLEPDGADKKSRWLGLRIRPRQEPPSLAQFAATGMVPQPWRDGVEGSGTDNGGREWPRQRGERRESQLLCLSFQADCTLQVQLTRNKIWCVCILTNGIWYPSDRSTKFFFFLGRGREECCVKKKEKINILIRIVAMLPNAQAVRLNSTIPSGLACVTTHDMKADRKICTKKGRAQTRISKSARDHRNSVA